MFHVELRQFPHNACAFNLSEDELLERVVGPWAAGEWVELGERKWSPHRAKLTVLEGPRLELADLAMGRGWRNAEHRGKDVTASVLAHSVSTGRAALESLLGAEPDALLAAWRLVAERRPDLAPSEALALAERTLGALDGVDDMDDERG